MNTIITIVYLLGVPLLVMQLAKRWSWIEKISPMTVLYLVGLAVANLIPADNAVFNVDLSANTLFSNIAVPLAIPLMLMGCDMNNWQVGKAFKVFLSGLLSVLIVTIAGYFIFRNGYHDSKGFAQVCAVATGIYTGGIPNMGAIKQAVSMPDATYLYITSYDLIVTGLYLVFVIFFGKTVFRKLLPAQRGIENRKGKTETGKQDTADAEPNTKIKPFDREHRGLSFLAIGITLAIAAVSYVVSIWTSKDGEPNMTVLILLLTTLAIGASFLPPMKRQQHSFDLGLYCVYVFCLAIATACNIREMDIAGSLPILYYLGFIILGSLFLQILFAKMLKIDGDSVMVCSVALINSPPFVPLAAALLDNKDIVILGITIGLLGYMLGNYLGIGIFHLLMSIG
ncbi:MAG: DUF819 family protein [Bacteroidales bacterium]|nr:DUF819 family protein [Bacteroidales bacterium]